MGEIEIRRLVEPEAFIPRPKAVAHRGEGRGDGGRPGTGLVGDAHDQRRAAAIDHRIAELGGDAFGQYRAGEPRADDQEVIFHLRKLKTESGETDN